MARENIKRVYLELHSRFRSIFKTGEGENNKKRQLTGRFQRVQRREIDVPRHSDLENEFTSNLCENHRVITDRSVAVGRDAVRGHGDGVVSRGGGGAVRAVDGGAVDVHGGVDGLRLDVDDGSGAVVVVARDERDVVKALRVMMSLEEDGLVEVGVGRVEGGERGGDEEQHCEVLIKNK